MNRWGFALLSAMKTAQRVITFMKFVVCSYISNGAFRQIDCYVSVHFIRSPYLDVKVAEVTRKDNIDDVETGATTLGKSRAIASCEMQARLCVAVMWKKNKSPETIIELNPASYPYDSKVFFPSIAAIPNPWAVDRYWSMAHLVTRPHRKNEQLPSLCFIYYLRAKNVLF